VVRRLPPFPAIRAFEAAAKTGSFKAAAEELCLSPSAISHQIRVLEDYLDTRLFDRTPGSVTLTHTGSNLAGKLTFLLDGLDAATREAKSSEPQTLRVLSTPGFAARWLVPRLDRFEHGDAIRLRVAEGAPSTDFARNDADFVVQWGDAPQDGLVVKPLMQSERFPIAHPEFIEREKIRTPEDLARVTIFRDEVDDQWPDWFEAAGVSVDELPAGPCFRNCELANTAAEQCKGVSLAYSAVVGLTLETGNLVRLFDVTTKHMTIYAIAYQQERAEEPLIRSFAEFLMREVSADGNVPTPLPRAAE